jgi:hypothetical protein
MNSEKKMYRTSKYNYNIEEFTVVKVTEKSVTYLRRKWVLGNIDSDEFVEDRQLKITNWYNWHDTLQDAIDHVRYKITLKIWNYKSSTETEKKNLEAFNLKYPL